MEPIPALPPLAAPALPAEDAAAAGAPPAPLAAAAAAPAAVNFDALMAELQAYQAAHRGSLAVPAGHPALARIADVLIATGVEDLASQRWDGMIAQLRAYKLQEGNCNVPPDHPLGAWAAQQREYYNKHERGMASPLTDARFDQLRGLGLTTNRWERRLEELREYRAQYGHCDVPLEHPGLGVWVMNQRDTYYFEKGAMPQDRVDALEALGFNWNRWGGSGSRSGRTRGTPSSRV